MIYHFGLYLLKTYLRTKIDKHFSKVEHYKQTRDSAAAFAGDNDKY